MVNIYWVLNFVLDTIRGFYATNPLNFYLILKKKILWNNYYCELNFTNEKLRLKRIK